LIKMDLPEETPTPEDHTPMEETFPNESVLPEGFTPLGDVPHLPRARRRRAHRMLVLPGADERATLLEDLARRAIPSFEFFLFAFLCGTILGAAYLLNAPALLLLGILLAPLLTSWVGMTLAAVTGSWRFFFLTLTGLLVAWGLVFLTGALAGLAGRLWNDSPFYYARVHAQLWWPDLLIVALGAALLAISFIRSEQKPVLASVMLAYGLFLPVSAAGIGLGIGREIGGVPLWPNGMLVFLVHLALSALVGGIVLVGMRFKPVRASGYLLPIFLGLLSLTGLVVLTGVVTAIRDGIAATRHIAPTPTSMILPSATPSVTQTLTPIPTNIPSATLSPTPTLQPTPGYAIITASSGGGANLRSEPAGPLISVLSNGMIVEVLPEVTNIGTENWVHVRVTTDLDGWVLQSVLTIVSLTPTPIPTSTVTP
jgi:hypothetical protein